MVSWTLGGFVSSKQESLSKIVQLTEDTNAYTNRNSYTNPYTDSLTKCYTNIWSKSFTNCYAKTYTNYYTNVKKLKSYKFSIRFASK